MPEDKKIDLPSYQEFYTNESLYTKFEITVENKQLAFDIILSDRSIDCYCPICKVISIFKTNNRTFPKNKYGTDIVNAVAWELDDREYTISFRCSREWCHNILFYLRLNDGKLSKIGQYPSVADLAEYDIKKYKNILGEFYPEFNKAVGLFAHGIGAGSYVYLRRIIENFIIKPAYEEAKLESGWHEGEYQKSRYKEKIAILKDKLPKFLTDNAKLYSVLSKGLHDMTEEECKKNFPVTKKALEAILNELQAKKDEEATNNEIENALNII
jgi:hypothetical protein